MIDEHTAWTIRGHIRDVEEAMEKNHHYYTFKGDSEMYMILITMKYAIECHEEENKKE